jgi:rSAM/selenodomain-associated transferase 2
MRLSIIIPTLNEARYLTATLEQVRSRAVLGPPHEIIVSDCGSTDGTAELAACLGARLAGSQPPPVSRAAACNCGAALATGDVLLFLDADSLVPAGYDQAIQRALRTSWVVGGAFEFALDGPQLGLRVVEFINQVRYRLMPLYYGDQGLFVRAAAFRAVGGYREVRLLESADLCRRLRGIGHLVLLRKPIKTSARRFIEGGILRVLVTDTRIWLLDFLGLPTEQYSSAYQEQNCRRGHLAKSFPSA